MTSDNPQDAGYTLLMNYELERLGELENEEEFELGNDLGTGVGLRATSIGSRGLFIWAVSSATFVYTTKRLLVNLGFHYPLTLALYYFISLFIVYILVLLLRGSCSMADKIYQHPLGRNWFLPNVYWVVMLPSSITASLSFPMLVEGILHMPSLPVLVMIFPLVYATESLSLFIYCRLNRKGNSIPWNALVIVTACSVTLYSENRLMVPGLIGGVLGMFFLGISRACFFIGTETAESEIAIQGAYHGFVTMTLVFGIFISGVLAYIFETIPSMPTTSLATSTIMILNILAIIGTSFPGTSIIAYSASSFDRRTSTADRNISLIVSGGSNLLLLLAAMFSNPLPYVNSIQIVAYCVANVCLIGPNQIDTWVIADKMQTAIHSVTKCLLTFTIIIISFTLSFMSSAAIDSLPQGPSTTYDRSYHPNSRFDIVVSMYEEDPSSIKYMVDQIKSTTLLQSFSLEGHKPQVILYTKNPTADLDVLKNTTKADIVERLENVGREGGTYLSHIVNKWDSLAEQTMFVQAHAHNMRELIPRINEYLVVDTGMLSLGFTGVTCSCGSCSDRWGWEDRLQIVPTIYEKVYNKVCNPPQTILLSYKGQFVASARRIRGVKRNIYVELLKTISTDEGWNRNATVAKGNYIGGVAGVESASNPFFGFAMERIWNLVMQCAANERVAARCPSLLSGKGIGGLVQDCQCLDELG